MKISKGNIGSISTLAIAALTTAACGKFPAQQEQTPAQQAGLELETEVQGLDLEGGKVQKSVVELKFALTGKDSQNQDVKTEGFECKLGKEDKFVPCNGSPFTVSGLKDGAEYHLVVRGIVRQVSSNKVLSAKESTNDFKVDLSQGDHAVKNPGLTGSAIAHKVQVGSFYRVDVPVGMHVTEYSTSKTTGVLSYFRIENESDPFYLGNHTCNAGWDRVVASITPAGEPMMYCHSTPTREAYKTQNEFRLAHNHVEIATDTDLVAAENHERLTFASYDEDYQLMNVRSRFVNACENAPQGKKYIDVPMINNFFLGTNPEKVRLWYCDIMMPGMDGTPETWRVGAFYDNDQVDWENPAFKLNRGLEAVYMVRANAQIFMPEYFARHAQERILDVLKKVLP